jgi:predicted DNA-binding transcriptional regulator YafY
MATKKAVRETPKRFNERLEIIDDLLYKYDYISRENLLRKLNSHLKSPITNDSLSNDIRDIKNEIEKVNLKKGSNVKLINNRNTGYFYSDHTFRLFRENVNKDDQTLLLLAASLFNIFQGTELHEKFENIVNRLIEESITTDKFINKKNKDFIQLESTIKPSSRKWIPQLLRAIGEEWCMEIMYQNNEGLLKKKHVCPYVIKQYNNKWYMVAYDHSSSRERKTNVFSLDNIKSIDHSNKVYFKDPNFNPQDYFKYSIGIWHEHDKKPITVVLEFNDKRQFLSIENNPLHITQQAFLNKKQDRLIVTLEVYESQELYSMIYKFGATVKVLEPTLLVEKVRANAEGVLNLYKNA